MWYELWVHLCRMPLVYACVVFVVCCIWRVVFVSVCVCVFPVYVVN
jgi:hypothetical protein